jgi:purine nucleosidase
LATHHIILDCDPGIDDAIAILLALSAPDIIKLHSVTTVFGNRPLPLTTRNALRVLALAERIDVPVFPGCARPILPGPTSDHNVHGSDGLGDISLPESTHSPANIHAVRHLIETVLSHPGEITICAIGPMTNIALALIEEAGLASKIREIAFMGGAAFGPGNTTVQAEFNIWSDPLAAQVVLSSGVPLTMFSLDVTRRARFTAAWIEALDQGATTPVTVAATAMLHQYLSGDPCLHDPCVVAYLIDPTLFGGVDARVSVDCNPGSAYGRTVATRRTDQSAPAASFNCKIMTTVDNERLLTLVARQVQRVEAAHRAHPPTAPEISR